MSASFLPMVDTAIWHQPIEAELLSVAERVLRSGRYILGEEVSAFEQEVAEYLGCKHSVSCANGTDALILALTAAGIKPGDEVITSTFSFFATAEAIARVGATPVFVDIEFESFNLNPDLLSAALSEKTRAVLIVHLFGLPARIQEVQYFCQEHKLKLIEDCAQSFGASVGQKQTGTFGDLGCFSFFPSKNLGGFGDGGLVSTDDDLLAERLKCLRNHGSSQKYHHHELGYNSRLDELQAALLRVKLKHIDKYNDCRRKVAEWYSNQLKDHDVMLPSGNGHVFHQYTTIVDQRDLLNSYLASKNIASAIYYPLCLHQQPVFRKTCGCRCSGDLFVAEQVSQRCLSLPIFPGMTEEQVARVCSVITEGVGEQDLQLKFG